MNDDQRSQEGMDGLADPDLAALGPSTDAVRAALADVRSRSEQLTTLLEQENLALRERDFAVAVGLLRQKTQAADALGAAHARLAQVAGGAEAMRAMGQDEVAPILSGALRLRQLLAENSGLLARALELQNRVIEAIVGAVPKALAAGAPSYGATGSPRLPRRADAFAYSTRA